MSRGRSHVLSVFACATLACGTSSSSAPADAGASDGGGGAPVGSPCLPTEELSATFASFRESEVTVEVRSAQCASGVCLVNHFRGRVSCPYGQDASGQPVTGAPNGCRVPGTSTPVAPNAPKAGDQVAAQCLNRRAAATVICSCRCANANGKTDDGAQYCTCPSGMQCTPLVSGIGTPGDTTSGSYCIPAGTAFDPNTVCNTGDCEPTTAPCE